MSYEFEKFEATQKDYDELENKFYKQQKMLKDARSIISDFVCSQISYMNVNNLGDPFKQQDVKRAIKFLMEDE